MGFVHCILPILIFISATGDCESDIDTDVNSTMTTEYSAVPTTTYPNTSKLELIYSERENLVRLDVNKPGNYEIIVEGQSNAVAVDYDMERQLVVWSDVRKKGIYSASIEKGSEVKIIAVNDVVTPDGLAVDWIHGNLYWTDTGTNTISVASLDGKMRKLLFHDELDEPRAIVLNPLEGWMFWTDWGVHSKIEKAGMDGSHRTKVIARDIAVPNGLAIDFKLRRLFWADVRLHVLRSSDYDGGNVETILQSITLLGHPFAVDVFQDWLYWTDWRSHSVSKVNRITGSDAEKLETRQRFFPMGLRVYHSEKQPKGDNYCEMYAECSHLCLPTPRIGEDDAKNFTCACPDGMTLTDNQKNCTEVTDGTTTTMFTTSTMISTTTECPYLNAFYCPNGRCIRSSWVCDGDDDCSDNSDEKNCSTPSTTQRTTTTTASYISTAKVCPYSPAFICGNGRCIKGSWVCDSDNDCGDNTDERHCNLVKTTENSAVPTAIIYSTTNSSSTTEAPSQSKLESHSMDKLLQEIHESVTYYGRFSGIIFGTFIFFIVLISLVGFYIYKQNLRGRRSSFNFVNPVFNKHADDAVRLELSRNSDEGFDRQI